ncbi:hypothetical protein BKA63DRAFT_544623 [Paraphoma chrysanthemicola]|nr:hypothetical protein BKA63DRAFT_544623 [Paraphoma chrysanthemicola]
MAAVQQYSGGKDFISAAKMNYFHYVLKQLTGGWMIHPSVGFSGKQPWRIGDMGTQTGVWAIDVAEDFTLNATVDAFDVSRKFFPPAEWLPPRLTLHVQDVLAPFPEKLLGKLDLVHFRLFLTLTAEKLGLMVDNAVTLLKPGGYIQWVEHDKTGLRPVTASAGQDTSAVEAFVRVQQNPFPNYNPAWVNLIAPTMVAKKLELVVEERYQTRPSLLMQMNELHLLSLVDIATGLSKPVDDFKERYFDMLAKDSARGIATVDAFIVVVAKKPLEE